MDMDIRMIHQDAKSVSDFLKQQNGFHPGDPNLIIKASTKYGKAQVNVDSCPGAVSRFGSGFVSYPITWWANHIHAGMLQGYFGKKQRMVAQLRQNILSAILHEAMSNPGKTFQVVKFYGQHKLSSDKAGTVGRLLGGVFTNYTTTRVPGKKGSPLGKGQQRGVALANFIMSSYGACIYAIAKGSRKFEDIISMIITGNYEANLCIDMSKFKYVPSIKVEYSNDDNQFIMSLLKGVDKLNQKNRNYLVREEDFKM